LWAFALIVLLCCAALPPYLQAKKSARWPSVDGGITASWMRSGYWRGVKFYRGEVEYRYRVGKTEYHGNAFSLGPAHAAAEEVWQRVLDEYPVGKTVKVYYDPGHPATAILEPGLHGEMEFLYKMDLPRSPSFILMCFLVAARSNKGKESYS